MTAERVKTRPRPVQYPESDGKPMGETDLHRDELYRLIYTLQAFFADRTDVYITGNLLLYYEEGNPRMHVSPDVMVVKGVPNHRRRTYKLWEEGVAPCFVIEVTSPTTRREDRGKKRDIYARLGVAEYFLYDPQAEYLRPPLQGFRLAVGVYLPIEPDADGAFHSAELPILLRLVNGMLRLFDARTGEMLLSPFEQAMAARAQAAVEARRADAEAHRADHETGRADEEAGRADAEARRAEAASLRAEAEAQARHAAERRIAELERLLREREPGERPGES